MALRIDENKYPGRAKYYAAMRDSWLTSKEVAFAVDADVATVDTVLRRWETLGYIERRKRKINHGKAPIEWRWRNG